MTGRLTGVGVGPGDPDLVTVRGVEALRTADVLFVPVAEETTGQAPAEPGYAERVVRAHVPHATAITRLPFSLDEGRRADAWRTAAGAVAAVVADGRHAVLATIGDPNVYSTFTYLARAVRERVADVEVDTVPGITAMQDLASRSGTVLVEHEEPLTLLPMSLPHEGGLERLRAALADGGTVVLYKGGRQLPAIREVLAAAGRLDRAVFGARLGYADQDLRDAVPEGPQPYLSTVIVPADRQDLP